MTKIQTIFLTRIQVTEEIRRIVDLLCSAGVDDLIVFHGWGSRMSNEELWKPIPLKTADLVDFVAASTKSGVFVPGDSDLIIEGKNVPFRFLICHESDIHLEAENDSLVGLIRQHWAKEGLLRPSTGAVPKTTERM